MSTWEIAVKNLTGENFLRFRCSGCGKTKLACEFTEGFRTCKHCRSKK